jgi:hypothetical protein
MCHNPLRTFTATLLAMLLCLSSCIDMSFRNQLTSGMSAITCLTALCQASYLDRGRWPKNIYELTDWARSHGYHFAPERYGHCDFSHDGDRLAIAIDQPDPAQLGMGFTGTLVVEPPTEPPTAALSKCQREHDK